MTMAAFGYRARTVALGLLAVLVLLTFACDTEQPGGFTSTAPADEATGTTEAEDVSGTTETVDLGTTVSQVDDGDDAGEWVELTQFSLPAGATLVEVTDDAIVYGTAHALEVYLLNEDRSLQIPAETMRPIDVAADDDLLVWFEADFETDPLEPAYGGLYSFRLPAGPTVEILGPGQTVADLRLAGDRVTWTEPRPSAEQPDMVWEYPVHSLQLDASGAPAADAELLVPAPTAFVAGDAFWVYDLSERYVAWEQHERAGDIEPGLYVLDLASDKETFIGDDSWDPSLSGSLLGYRDGDGLHLLDLASGRDRLIDAEGYLPSVESSYVAYITDPQGPDPRAWQIIVTRPDSGTTQTLGGQEMPSWVGSTISTSDNHVAFVDVDGEPRVFQWEDEEG